MRKDTNKLCIGICGNLPGAVELMESRDDVEYTTFSNGSERYAKNTLQAWLIGLLLEKPWSGGELAYRLAAEKMSEVENTLAEEWTEPGDIDGWEILRIIKGSGAKAKGSPDVYVTKLVLHTFHNDFHAFLRRETPPFTLARETA